MSASLYDITIPVFVRYLDNLSACLEKGRSYANEKDLPHTHLLEARLFDDMMPLVAQIQRATDSAKFTAVRVGNVQNVVMEDKETTFDDLQARIAATIEFLKAVPPDSMNGRENAEVELKTPKHARTFTGLDYVTGFALPNFFFHVTTAYDLLRSKGVPLGKMDYLGWT